MINGRLDIVDTSNMLFGDRRQPSSRISNRQLKNILFTLIMIFQIFFWVYVLIIPSTNSVGQKIFTRGEINRKSPIQVDDEPSIPRMIKPLLRVNEREEFIKRDRAANEEIDDETQGGYLDDIRRKEIIAESGETTGTDRLDFNKYFNPLLRHTILHRDAYVIWNGSFLMNPTTICSRYSDLDLLVIVHTAPYNFQRRAMLRQQLGNARMNSPYTVQLAFMIGSVQEKTRDISWDAKIASEYNDFGDLVMMDFMEDFRNLTLKAVMWLKWTNHHCKNANMILKIDDDVVIDVQKILPLSRGLFSKYEKSIFCHLNKIGSQPIPRTGRTAVDPREFMRMSFYPYNYCSGFIVFLTPDLIPHFVKTVHQIPFYNVDDVFMFGMVPKFTGSVTYHNIGYNVSIWNKKVLMCNLERGLRCPYFGTMGEEEDDRMKVWSAITNNHAHEFHFPQLRLLA